MRNPSFVSSGLDAVTAMPVGIEHPAAFGAAAVGIGAYIAAERLYDRSDNRAYATFSNESLLVDTVSVTPDRVRRSTLRTVGLFSGGLTLAAVGMLGAPYSTESIPSESSQTIVILDASTTMSATKDFGVSSRLDATTAAFDQVDIQNSGGEFSIIQVGADAAITLPFTKNPTSEVVQQALIPIVDSNGTNLSKALETASQLFGKDEHSKQTVVVITDGTVTSSEAELNKSVASLSENGVQIEVIIPGQENATYQLGPGSPVEDSGIRPEKVAMLDSEPTIVSDTGALLDVAQNTIAKATTESHNKRWRGLEVAGGTAVIGAVGNALRLLIRRR